MDKHLGFTSKENILEQVHRRDLEQTWKFRECDFLLDDGKIRSEGLETRAHHIYLFVQHVCGHQESCHRHIQYTKVCMYDVSPDPQVGVFNNSHSKSSVHTGPSVVASIHTGVLKALFFG